jgi:hypothetical protein
MTLQTNQVRRPLRLRQITGRIKEILLEAYAMGNTGLAALYIHGGTFDWCFTLGWLVFRLFEVRTRKARVSSRGIHAAHIARSRSAAIFLSVGRFFGSFFTQPPSVAYRLLRSIEFVGL